MIDLHTHSVLSDGSDPPERIPELAAAAGCRAVALTDHDRLDGLAAAAARAGELGVELVPGCEISCDAGLPGSMHVLVWFVADGEGPLQDELAGLLRAREERNVLLAERLAALGLPVTLAEMEEEAGEGSVGRPHVAAILVRKGVVGSMQEAFDVWLGQGRPAYVEKRRLAPAEAIGLARASGGVAALAHPLSLGLDPPALDGVVAELAELGLAGLESVYGRYAPDERGALVAMAERHGLVATGGSDYHGTYKPDLAVGVGQGDLMVDDAVLDALRGRAA